MWLHSKVNIVCQEPVLGSILLFLSLTVIKLVDFEVNSLIVYSKAYFWHPSVVSTFMLQISHIVLILASPTVMTESFWIIFLSRCIALIIMLSPVDVFIIYFISYLHDFSQTPCFIITHDC